MDVASSVIGWVGAVSGVTALVWQISTRRRGAHRVRVRTTNAYPMFPGAPVEHFICVTAINDGAGSVTVAGWGIEVANGQNAIAVDPVPFSARLPYRLEPGESASFYMPAQAMRERHRSHLTPYRRMRPFVLLATGRRVQSRNPVAIGRP